MAADTGMGSTVCLSDGGGGFSECDACEFMKLAGDGERELEGAIEGAARKLDASPLNW